MNLLLSSHVFERQWVGVKQSEQHASRINNIEWYCHSLVKKGLPKTTSSLEGWHKHFAKLVGQKSPKMNRLFKTLQDQQARTEAFYQESSVGRKQPNKRAKQKDKAEKLLQAVKKPYTVKTISLHPKDIARVPT